MDREKQIEEMAFILGDACNDAPIDVCETKPCNYCRAEALYNAGYRKQSEGEWIEHIRVSKEGKPLLRHYKCNLCGVYLARQANFCPNCGAKMKGGAE